MTSTDFSKALQMPNQGQTLTEDEIKAGFGTDNAAQGGDVWGDAAKKDPKAPAKADDGWGAPAPKKKHNP